MKVENIREVKTRFSHYVKGLPRSGFDPDYQKRPAVRGAGADRASPALARSRAAWTSSSSSVTDDTDLEALTLSQNKRFWKLIDEAIEPGKREGFVDLEDL